MYCGHKVAIHVLAFPRICVVILGSLHILTFPDSCSTFRPVARRFSWTLDRAGGIMWFEGVSKLTVRPPNSG